MLLQFVQVVITLGIINAKWSTSRTPDQVTTPYSSQHSTTKYVRVSHGVWVVPPDLRLDLNFCPPGGQVVTEPEVDRYPGDSQELAKS